MKTIEAVDLFIESRILRGSTAKTIESYGWALGKMKNSFPDELPLTSRDITSMAKVNAYLAPESQKDLFTRLRTFWRWTEEEGIAPNLMKNFYIPRTRRKLPRTLSDAQVHQLFSAVESERDYAVLAVLLDTGIRVGELASLTRESLHESKIHVEGKTGERVVPVTPGVMRLLKKQGDRRGPWIGHKGRLSRWGLQSVVRRSMRRAGFDVPKIGPHTLRHTFGVKYIRNGGDVFSLQKIFGHAKVETTMIYVDMSNSVVASQHRKFSPMRDLTAQDTSVAIRRYGRGYST